MFVPDNQPPNQHYGGCALEGISLGDGRNLGNLGSLSIALSAGDRDVRD